METSTSARLPTKGDPTHSKQEADQSWAHKSLGQVASSSQAIASGYQAEISKVNFLRLSFVASEAGVPSETISPTRLRSLGVIACDKDLSLMYLAPTDKLEKIDEECDKLPEEKFPLNVSQLMNEDHYWGCFYNFPSLYDDACSPTVRVRHLPDVPDIVQGVLTRDLISACLTYLRRIPILGDFVFIKLDLSDKHLINIEVLQHYKYLVYLDLSCNYLSELTVLSNLLYLQFLSVSYNRLSTVLEYEVAQWFLSEVHYKFNSVKKIRDLTMFWSLTVLDLSHNNITCISGLENLNYLRRLDLSFNHIQRLENLNNLRLLWLDVSYNNISTFEFGPTTGLWTLYHLVYLNLNENNLTSMKIFSGCTGLREVHARNNRLSYLLELAVYMRQLRRLTILDLRSNPMCSTPSYKEVTVSTFPNLLYLDAEQLDPVDTMDLKMKLNPPINMLASRRLLRLLYIEQLSRAKVSPFVLPFDTTEVPLVIFVGYEGARKGTLARRLAAECSSNVELAIQHTTARYHDEGRYKVVSRNSFDDMLLNGDFLSYTEINGESYGLSREEAYVKDGKVKILCTDLTSALMIKMRGLRPYLILISCNPATVYTRQKERKQMRDQFLEEYPDISLRTPVTLQVLVSGHILVTGILNEILFSLPDEKGQSLFQIESGCSLLKNSESRQAMPPKGIDKMQLLNLANESLEEFNEQQENSLCSLYQRSQSGTYDYSDTSPHNSITEKKSNGRSQARFDKVQESAGPKLPDIGGRVSTRNSSAQSSKTVSFNSQYQSPEASTLNDNLPRHFTGLMIEPPVKEESSKQNQNRSLSRKFQHDMGGHPPPGHRPSGSSFDEGDLWLKFLADAGMLVVSDPGIASSETAPRHQTRYDDPETILRQLAIYQKLTNPIRPDDKDEYADMHREFPGLFRDTISTDDPDAAVKKAKKILKGIVKSQETLQPMFDMDLDKMILQFPTVEQQLQTIADEITPKKFFF